MDTSISAVKRKYLLFMSYIGSRYRGAAKQIGCSNLLDVDSIEGALEIGFYSAIHPHSKCYPRVRISSRTDAGVHALCNSAEIVLKHPKDEFYDPNYVLPRLNLWLARCGHEIRVTNFYPVIEEFSYRQMKSRTYFYRFMIAKEYGENRIPIAELGRSWHIRGENIDLDALNHALRLFRSKKNYSSFSPKNKTNRNINYVKELTHISLEPTSSLMPEDPLSDNFNFWKITVQSKSFVYNQVRRIVGALISLASQQITEKQIKIMLNCPSYLNWDSAIQIAPPQGLYLKTVEYDKEVLDQCIINVKHESQDLPIKNYEEVCN